MTSSGKNDWDKWISQHYAKLVTAARKYHADAEDLVHSCYLICREKPDVQNHYAYFVRVMQREAYSGKFKSEYHIDDTPLQDIPAPENDHDPFIREQLELYIDRLHRFDRLVWKLHNEGYSMVEIAHGTGIPLQTLYNSLNQTRKTIRQCFYRSHPKSGQNG